MALARTALFVAALLSFALTRASAQAPAGGGEEPLDYRETVQLATEEFNLHNYAEARALFAKAHALAPSARTWRGLGLAEFELRNYPKAVEHLERALVDEVKPLAGEMRASTLAVLRRAHDYVGRVVFEVAPAATNITLNGQPLERTGGELVLSVGDHVLEFDAIGYVTQRRTLRVVHGSQTLSVVLRSIAGPNESSAAGASHRGDAQRAGVPTHRRWWLWTSIAVLAAGAAAATAIMVRGSPGRTEAYRRGGATEGPALVFGWRAAP